MATISSANAWTGLKTNLAPYEDVQQPAPMTVKIHPDDLANPPDEIGQFLRLAQAGFGALLGSGKRLDFGTTIQLVEQFLKTYKTQGFPRSGS